MISKSLKYFPLACLVVGILILLVISVDAMWGCSCEGKLYTGNEYGHHDGGDVLDTADTGADRPAEPVGDPGWQDTPDFPHGDETVSHDPPPAEPDLSRCTGEYAYLHGDLWTMWYNMRVACDPEHKALWRCRRIHGADAPECAGIKALYRECQDWNSPWPCLNYGVCAPVEGTVCTFKEGDVCDTRDFDYASPEIWGSYYGRQWGSRTDLHRFLTIHVKDSGDNLVIAFSARPGSADAYMDELNNFGVGPEPQGFIQIIRSGEPEKFTDRFGSFACIRLPAGQRLRLKAMWMNEFCHTCASDYDSQPHTPCWTEEIAMSFEPGRHYLWTERGIELMGACTGPPADISARLPGADCSTDR